MATTLDDVAAAESPDPGGCEPADTRRPTGSAYDRLAAELVEIERHFPVPDDAAIRADCRWLQARLGTEAVARYRGEHVAVLDGVIVGHAGNALQLQLDLARARGVHPQRLVVAYVDPPDF